MASENIGFVKDSRFERWRWQIFVITWLSYASFYFTRKAFSVAKVGIEADPDASITREMMATLDGTYLAAYAAGQFIWGMMSDKYGPRVVVGGGLLISAVAALAMGSAVTFPIFAICMVVQGLCQSTGWSGLLKNLSNFFSNSERGRAMGFWSTCYAFGGLVAAPFAGYFAYSLFDGWRWAFFSTAALVFGVFMLFLLLQRNKPQDVGLCSIQKYHGEKELEIPESRRERLKSAKRDAFREIKLLMKNRAVLALGMAYFLLKPARYAILFWGPIFVIDSIPDVGMVGAAIIPTSFELAGLLGPILIGFASDKLFGARRVPPCAFSLIGLTCALALFNPLTELGNPWIMMGILFMIGLFLYGPDSIICGAASVDFGAAEGAGTAAGFVNGCGSIGAVLGGVLPGFMSQQSVFWLFTGASMVALVVLLPFWNVVASASKSEGEKLEAGVLKA